MPTFLPMLEISGEASSYARCLPLETRQSYPVPMPGPKGLRVAFLFCDQHLVPFEGALIMPPSYRAYVDAATGKLQVLQAVVPADFGRTDDPAQYLGVARPSDDVTTAEFPALEARLYELYDRLLPPFAEGRSRLAGAVPKDAAEFRALFARLSEIPLRPYYASAGQEFFAWLAQVTR